MLQSISRGVARDSEVCKRAPEGCLNGVQFWGCPRFQKFYKHLYYWQQRCKCGLHSFEIILKLGGILYKDSWAGSTKTSFALEDTVAVPALLNCQKLALPFPVCKLVCSQINHLCFMFPRPLLPVIDLAYTFLCAGRN